ncbi:hypothetical protein [Promicromonospora sp. NPDC050249]|uniref:hypothetical protein n=1 Tax=Promicromonospora sp. NPDC050249 TaxID=3154743 RepID=UPI0033F0C24A
MTDHGALPQDDGHRFGGSPSADSAADKADLQAENHETATEQHPSLSPKTRRQQRRLFRARSEMPDMGANQLKANVPQNGVGSLQAFDAARRRELWHVYSTPDTVTLDVEIVEAPTTYSTLVPVQITTTLSELTIHLYYPLEIVAGHAITRAPVTYVRVSSEDERAEFDVSQGSESTVVRLMSKQASTRQVTIEIDLDTAFVKEEFSGFSDNWQLGLGLRFDTAARVVMNLDHPEHFALRARLDNSEYHTLAQGIAPGRVRKLGFFPGSEVLLSYRYGLADQSMFLNLARLPFGAAFGCLNAGLSIAFIMAGLEDLGATTLAFSLLPPLVRAITERRSEYRSADIHDRRATLWLSGAPTLIYFPIILFAILTITDWAGLRELAQILAYSAAGGLALHGSLIVLAVRQQVIPEHYCDMCGNRIVWRRRQHLDILSRRTLCRSCGRERGITRGYR